MLFAQRNAVNLSSLPGPGSTGWQTCGKDRSLGETTSATEWMSASRKLTRRKGFDEVSRICIDKSALQEFSGSDPE